MFVAYVPSLITMLATLEPRTKAQVQVSPLTPLHLRDAWKSPDKLHLRTVALVVGKAEARRAEQPGVFRLRLSRRNRRRYQPCASDSRHGLRTGTRAFLKSLVSRETTVRP